MADFDFDNYNPSLMRGTSSTLRNRSKVFERLMVEAQKLADKIVEDRAEKMQFILRNRIKMTGVGRYPKFDGSDDPKTKSIKSKKSYLEWKVVRRGKNINLTNTAEAIDGFSYPLLLLNGDKKGTYHWRFDTPSNKVNAGGFSTQMPDGISPFIKRHRALLVDEIHQAFKGLK